MARPRPEAALPPGTQPVESPAPCKRGWSEGHYGGADRHAGLSRRGIVAGCRPSVAQTNGLGRRGPFHLLRAAWKAATVALAPPQGAGCKPTGMANPQAGGLGEGIAARWASGCLPGIGGDRGTRGVVEGARCGFPETRSFFPVRPRLAPSSRKAALQALPGVWRTLESSFRRRASGATGSCSWGARTAWRKQDPWQSPNVSWFRSDLDGLENWRDRIPEG